MNSLFRLGCRTFAVVVLGGAFPLHGLAQSEPMECDPCTVGVVLDGLWEHNDELLTIFTRAVTELIDGDPAVVFPEDKRLFADSTAEGIGAAIDQLLADEDVDLLLTAGPLASSLAARREALMKPVIATFVIDPDVQGIPTAVNDEWRARPHLHHLLQRSS